MPTVPWWDKGRAWITSSQEPLAWMFGDSLVLEVPAVCLKHELLVVRSPTAAHWPAGQQLSPVPSLCRPSAWAAGSGLSEVPFLFLPKTVPETVQLSVRLRPALTPGPGRQRSGLTQGLIILHDLCSASSNIFLITFLLRKKNVRALLLACESSLECLSSLLL